MESENDMIADLKDTLYSLSEGGATNKQMRPIQEALLKLKGYTEEQIKELLC